MNPKISALTVFCLLCLASSFVCHTRAGSSNRSYPDGRWPVSENDTVFLAPQGVDQEWSVTGAVFNAIDPGYIANPHGFTVTTYILNGKKSITKQFKLVGFNESFYSAGAGEWIATPLTAKSWNYYIDNAILFGYGRVLVSALMLDAVEKIEYSPVGSVKSVQLMYEADTKEAAGEVRIFTRTVPEGGIDDSATRYVLDDVEITSKMFRALNHVFIRSLERITDKKEISEYGYRGCKEIVKISLFSIDDIIGPVIRINDGGDTSVIIVDGMAVDHALYSSLNRRYFKEVFIGFPEGDATYSEYINAYPGKKHFTIITL